MLSNRRGDVDRRDDNVLAIGGMHFCFALDMGGDLQKRGFHAAWD
jgi:hypothetical protein